MHTNNSSITFIWIPSHANGKLNKETDSLAKNASQLSPNVAPISSTDFWEQYKATSQNNTLRFIELESQKKGVEYYKNYYTTR